MDQATGSQGMDQATGSQGMDQATGSQGMDHKGSQGMDHKGCILPYSRKFWQGKTLTNLVICYELVVFSRQNFPLYGIWFSLQRKIASTSPSYGMAKSLSSLLAFSSMFL